MSTQNSTNKKYPIIYNIDADDFGGMDAKEVKKIIRKQIKNTLTKIFEKALFDDKYSRNEKSLTKVSTEQSLNEAMTLYGTLTNSVTKKSDLIFETSVEYVGDVKLAYYTVSNKELFKSFPSAGTYLGPFKSCKKVFLEVLAQVEDFYICKAATQLRYLELLSIEGEKK
jgi:hypothetical protein